MDITKIKKVQTDKGSEAWLKLCAYIDKVAADGDELFFPFEYLGSQLFEQIDILPTSIRKLTQVKKMAIYGSNLVMLPPEIGEMKSLQEFIPYTSYNLCWFPYEITRCSNLKSSTVSTRALYYNPKNRKPFPNLVDYPVRYNDNLTVKCSICDKETTYKEIRQYWISLYVATDVLPLLVNLCSYECGMRLPKPVDNYPQFIHRGGTDLKPMSENDWK